MPRFLPDYCNECSKFGHYARDCKYLHTRAPDLLNAYLKRERSSQNNKQKGQVNLTQKSKNKSDNIEDNKFSDLMH